MPNNALKKFVVIDDETCENREILRQSAAEITFPLSTADLLVVEELNERFNLEQPCAGLAAPQLGYSKKIIIFHVPEDFKTYRKDVHEVVPPTVFVNPKYQPIGNNKALDWEACFSVKDTMAEIYRYQEIQFQAQDLDGNPIQGTAQGFLARLLQHEIGHLTGELFIDLIQDASESVGGRKVGRSGPIEEMRALRLKERDEANASSKS